MAAPRKKAPAKRSSLGPTRRMAVKKTGGGVFMLPLQPTGPLVEIVGHEPLPRTEVTKRVWAYIRNNRLQVRGQPRLIECDEKLRALTGQDRCDMLELTAHIARYLGDSPEPVGRTGDWSDEELRAAVEAYLRMQEAQRAGKPYSKADVRAELRGDALRGRTDSAIEYRMQNISAVLAERGQDHLPGYLPARNVGKGVAARIARLLDETDAPEATPTADPAELERRVRRLRKMAPAEIPPGIANPKRQEAKATAFVRDPAVKAWVLRNANGECELCLQPAPFTDADGFPFLEVHHVTTLADGGADTISNAVALCPNCHRRLHFADDRAAAAATLRRRLQRLM